MTDKHKRNRISQMSTEALRMIVNSQHSDAQDPSPEAPLRGQVHLAGIGRVSIRWLREELTKREDN